MNVYSKVAEGLAAWLAFEQRCGRASLFSESSLAHPLGQLLQYRYAGRVSAEVEHPVLAPRKSGPGQRPRVDFVVEGGAGSPLALAVESKWASQSPTLAVDLLRDIIRLQLMLGLHASDAILVLAGECRRLAALFSSAPFCSHAASPRRPPLLPVEEQRKHYLRLSAPSADRARLFRKALAPFSGLPISTSIRIERSGPFPRQANARSHEVYIFRIRNYSDTPTFLPEQAFPDVEA